MTGSSGKKAIDYAEVQLGIHTVYTELLTKRSLLDTVLTQLANLRDKRANTDMLMTDTEMTLAANERSKNPEMSAAAMDKHLKIVIHGDANHRTLRNEILKIKSGIDGYELDKSIFEMDIKIGCARLTELGGYFQYLAVVKQADMVEKLQNKGGGLNGTVPSTVTQAGNIW